MSTYEEPKIRKSLLEKSINFIKSHNGFICIVIGLVCIPILYIAFNAMWLKPTVENYYKTIEGSRFVEIPDSLQNIEVIRAKEYQQKIYAYSLYMLHANMDYDIDIKEISAKSDTFSKILSANGVAKKNQNTFADAMNCLLRMPLYRNLMLKYISQFKTINNFVALVDSINDYYFKSDSSIISTQLNLKGLEGLKSYMITQEINQEVLCKQLNQMHERIEDSESLDFSSQSRIRYEESEKIRKCLEKLLKDGSFEKTYDSVYNLSLDFIGILNLVQLKYAYNIDL